MSRSCRWSDSRRCHHEMVSDQPGRPRAGPPTSREGSAPEGKQTSFAELKWVGYLTLALGLTFSIAQVAPVGWQRISATGLFVGAAALGPMGLRIPKLRKLLWAIGGLLLVAAVLISLTPPEAQRDGQSSSASPSTMQVSPSAPETTPSLSPTSASSTPESSTLNPAPALQVELVTIAKGIAVETFGGELSVGLDGVYDTYATLNVFTPDNSCSPVWIDVAETVRFRQRTSPITFEVTLLRSTPATGTAEVRVVRRSEVNEWSSVSCGP